MPAMVHPRTLRATLTEARWQQLEQLVKDLARHGYTRDDVIEQILFHGVKTMQALAAWHAAKPQLTPPPKP
jgi:hypothetical protein